MISLRAPWWTAPLLTIGILSWAGAASAQSVAVTETDVQREVTIASDRNNQLFVSRADCEADDHFYFPVTLTSYGSYKFEVWVGTGCDGDHASRYSQSPQCWKVFEGANSNTFTVPVSVRSMVAKSKADSAGSLVEGTIDDCHPTDTSMKLTALTIFFLQLNSGDDTVVASYQWTKTQYDLVGPPAPTEVSAGVGETMLKVEWTSPEDLSDVVSYRFYCDPIPGKETTAAADAGMTVMAADADIDVVDPEAGTDDAGEDAGQDAGVDAADDAGTDAREDAAADAAQELPANCPATHLVSGQIPDETYFCGTGTGTSGKVTGLQNGLSYSVAVAAVDAVGNTGPLSNIACESPSPVDDFFDLYREAGGAGGGGFCSLTGVPGAAGHAGLAAGLAALAAAALLRRRAR